MAVNLEGNSWRLQTESSGSQNQQALIHSAASSASSREDAKIVKAGKDFESILLGSWLQQAEQSFATVPGGDGQDDDDAGKGQFQAIAMQGLAGSLTASGGIGIAKMITKSLREHQGSPPDAPPLPTGSEDSTSHALRSAQENSGLSSNFSHLAPNKSP